MARQQIQQQQQKANHPPPSAVSRPASVLLESPTGYRNNEQNNTTGRPRSQSHTVYSDYVPPPSSTSSSVSSQEAGDNPVRFQNWRQPPHRSKLSKQYTPSEDDSDDEPLGRSANNAEVRMRSKFMSGAALELNSDTSETLSDLSLSQAPSRSATPSLTESGDSTSVKSAKKKVSLGKRISMFFTGAPNSTGKSSHLSSTPSASSSDSSTSSRTGAGKEARLSAASLAPVDELTPPGRIHSVYIHQRSQSTPDQIGATDHNRPRSHTLSSTSSLNPRIEDNRLHRTRDSGYEEAQGRGHRRNSSTVNGSSVSGRPTSHNSRTSIYADQLQAPSSTQHSRRSVYGMPPVSPLSSSPQLRAVSDNDLHLLTPRHQPTFSQNHRHSYVEPEMSNPASSSFNTPAMPRRGSTPVPSSGTLISKVDREKASVCFQQPSAKKDAYTRDAHLDPALSNLVQQHRKDYMTNHRLGGTPTTTQSQQQQGNSSRARSSMYLTEDLYQQHQQQQLLPYPTSPGLYASETQMKRLSTSSQNFQPHLQHQSSSPGQQHRGSFSGSQSSLNQFQQPQQQQSSPSLGPHRSSPNHQNSPGYFTMQQAPQQLDASQLMHMSPFSSPGLGAVQTGGLVPESSLQHQQQQQLEHLQQIRLNQEQLLLQQRQHLQQQLQQQQQQLTPIGLGSGGMSTTPVGSGMTMGMGMGMVVNQGAISPLVLAPAYLQQPPQQHMPLQHMVTYGATGVPMYVTAPTAYH
ncbi:hypothetical protein BGZ70_007391 [Mortierella alpina]|uniref:Uncharacterized protein n=1 Tax=Mortierella alpina TaxID=64518 RepID=A0A9P6J611_MORAP|nr:hypothetical protein BGZ70_007391 [Mortierella alpina]